MANTTDVRKTQTVKRTQTSRGAAGIERPRSASGEARPSSEPKTGTENTENAGGKRPRRRMKKQVRRTLGGLFLASAIVVAAIPTPEASATVVPDNTDLASDDIESIKVSVNNTHNTNNLYTTDQKNTAYYKNYLEGAPTTYMSDVPFATERGSNPEEQIVYTSADGLFQFVYMRPTTSNPNRVAVILGYNGSETSLTIPDTMEGFRKYSVNVTSTGYCLVSKNNNFLHYRVETTETVQKEDAGGHKYYIVTFPENCRYNGVDYIANDRVEISDDQTVWPGLYYDNVEGAWFINGTRQETPTPMPTVDPATPPDPTPTPYDVNVKCRAEAEMVTNTIVKYEPCYSETRGSWNEFADSDLYYYENNDTTTPIQQCGENTDNWRILADVAYVGQEYLRENPADPGTWQVAGVISSPDQGVFANNPSLTNLAFGQNMVGLGDFAFYGCSTLSSVDFGPKLATIGNGAFASCIRLTNCAIAPNANIRALGKDAFYNCRSLTSFTTNIGMKAIGDSCFENCIALSTVQFGGDGGEVDLENIGYHAFRGCSALAGIEFPASYSEPKPLELDTFQGCSSLQFIKINNDTLDFDVFHVDGKKTSDESPATGRFNKCDENTWKNQKAGLPDSFYFEAADVTAIHETCKEQSISFKYINEDRYERKVFEIDKQDKTRTDGVGGTAKDADDSFARSAPVTYQINSAGEILKVAIEKRAVVTLDPATNKWEYTGASLVNTAVPINLTIPEKIGPYGIDTIGEAAFANNCSLEKVTIPESVVSIGDRAFAGCHNLETVIYTDATKVQHIGTDAFKTQDCMHTVVGTNMQCNQCGENFKHRGNNNNDLPELTFCGYMINGDTGADTVPFEYAMNGQSNINNSDQITSWIKYHSGWPTNLVVQYDYNSITGEGDVKLVDYPRYTSTTAYGNDYYGYDDPDNFVASLPYLDEDDDPDTYNYFKDFVSDAVTAYNNYKLDPRTNPAPTEQQMTLINAALNIMVPTNVDAIDDSIFSGAYYDAEGCPVYVIPGQGTTAYNVSNGDNIDHATDGKLIYTDASGKYYTDENKSTELDASQEYMMTKIPYVSDDTKGLMNKDLQTITLNGVDSVEPFTFYGCTDLTEASVIGADYIGDYAFDGCTAMTNATIGSNVTDVGLRPFRGCENLSNVNCLSPDFTYNSGLLVRGSNELVECLEGRGNLMGSYAVGPNELSGITSIRPEAFMDCDNVGKVDLSTASLGEIPERCFRDAEQLNSVVLGSGVGQIYEEAFLDTPNLKTVTLPYSLAFIAQDAFADTSTVPSGSFNDSNHHNYGANGIIVSCVENSTADKYAKAYVYMKPEYGAVFITHNVYFWDNLLNPSSPVSLGKQIVNDGEDAVPPTEPSHDGYEFTGWTNYQNIVKDTDVFAQFKTEDDPVYTVVFLDYDGTVIAGPYSVSQNKSATKPQDPSREGYTFTGWKCTDDYGISYTDADCYNNVTSDRVVVAQYKDNSGEASRHTVNFYSSYDNSLINTQKVDHGESAVAPQVPTVSGYTFKSFIPSTYKEVTEDMNIIAYYEKNSGGGGGGGGGGGTASPDPTATATPASGGGATGLAKTYTVSVSGGSGSGNYPAGAVVAVNAYDMGTGQVFDKWTTSTAGVAFANPSSPSTSFVMPAANVAITATYRTGGSGSSSSTGSGGGSGSGSGGTATRNGSGSTTVDITKGGISNTNVAGATVSGSTDNFVVKITDDQTASEMALRALQNSYGDITRLKYLPMDISLYDSTGRTKIADTAGLSVSITMPLPTELAQYAGNNKIASVAGGTLDPLNSRFTTVDGVPCISFTATHFSPYVIWVDTGDLTESTIDYTPKTGDPIHPKWFLAIGLACISLVLFFKRDKKVKVTPA